MMLLHCVYIDPPVITDFTDTPIRVEAGGTRVNISVNIDANPPAENSIAVVNVLSVPPSISVEGNDLVVFNATRSDFGEYAFVATNSLGEARVNFIVIVECECRGPLSRAPALAPSPSPTPTLAHIISPALHCRGIYKMFLSTMGRVSVGAQARTQPQ